jgi:hypothetical protein
MNAIDFEEKKSRFFKRILKKILGEPRKDPQKGSLDPKCDSKNILNHHLIIHFIINAKDFEKKANFLIGSRPFCENCKPRFSFQL